MSSLVPVVAGIAVGIGFIVTFAMIFNQPTSMAPTQYESKLAQLFSYIEVNCTDPRCAVDIVADCDDARTAIIESGNDRVWMVSAVNSSSYCHGIFTDLNVLTVNEKFGDSISYNCPIPHQELSRVEKASFDMLLSNVSRDSGWRCNISVP
jgi:hypothetical protein